MKKTSNKFWYQYFKGKTFLTALTAFFFNCLYFQKKGQKSSAYVQTYEGIFTVNNLKTFYIKFYLKLQ